AVRPGNGAHAVGRRLIVEQNAATPVDLQIDEAGGQEDAAREARLRPIGGNLAPGTQSSDASVPDQHRGFGMPPVTVKNTVRQDDMPVGGCRIVSARAHRCPWQAGLVSQQIQSKLKGAEYQSITGLATKRETAWTDWSFVAAIALKARSRSAGRRTPFCRRLPRRCSVPDGWSWATFPR